MPDYIDPSTGITLLPGDPEHCQGNGESSEYECCCDECDYFLGCYPEYARKDGQVI